MRTINQIGETTGGSRCGLLYLFARYDAGSAGSVIGFAKVTILDT